MKHELIGDKFVEVLKDWLSCEKIESIKILNARETTTLNCASHYFCDANEAMIEAFYFFNEDLPDDEGGYSQFILWNNAWSYAKKKHLTA